MRVLFHRCLNYHRSTFKNWSLLTTPCFGLSKKTHPHTRPHTHRHLNTTTVRTKQYSNRMATVGAYGTWKSPITSQVATEKSVSFQEVHVDKSLGGVYWTELRVEEAGRQVVCSKNGSSDVSWTPESYNARTLVHEYGGGASIVHKGNVYFSNFSNQRLYVQTSADEAPQALTPEEKGWRYADGEFSEKHNKLYYVREDHGEEKKEAVNTIVTIDPNTQQQNVLVSGTDFYSSPRVSPDGSKLVWVQWIHPNMPWNTTELWVADLTSTGDGLVGDTAHKVAGGDNTSVMQPKWTSDNRLLYIGDQTNWWNLYLIESANKHTNLHAVDKELGGPHWQFATYAYDIDPSGNGLIATNYGGKLGILNLSDKSYNELDTGYSSHSFIQYDKDGVIYCKAASPTRFQAVIRVHVDTGKTDIVKRSRDTVLDEGYISVPDAISWPTGEVDGEVSYGFYYAPKNKDYSAPACELPPLLVKAHGGPTSQAFDALNLVIQYFTSRGFAVLDVNYRGSTGFGKTYRHKLNNNWGIYDVEDCSRGALYLTNDGKVDKDRLCIDGGSAGGYTTLACLAFRDIFKAGASHYGVGDVEILMQETHKFESRYCDNLICPYTEENLPIIHARSPIKHIDKFSCPIVFFQGLEDKIVPPNQAQLMFDAVKEKGLTCAIVLFEGEQHGFRKSENIRMALDGEFYFFGKVFGFEPADKEGELPISNL